MTTPNEELRKQLQQIYKSGELYYRGISDTTDLLQSQAERIKALEAAPQVGYFYKWKDAMHGIAKLMDERDTLRAQLADAELHTKQVERGLDKALAQLEKIAATEPSMIYHGRCVIDCGDSGHQDVTMLKMIARETKLFTRPMPAQDVEASMIKLLDENFALRAELADMAVNTATYEHLVGLANDTATRLLKERDTLRAELAAIAARGSAKIERKIYKDTPEYRSYLDARFTPGRLGGSFELDGHRWAYHWTSFDDAGDFDLIYRWVEPKHSPMPAQDVTELLEAFEHHIEQTRPIERSTIALSRYKGAK